MIPAVNRFFDAVLVMAEDPRLRQNRLGMLQRIAALATGRCRYVTIGRFLRSIAETGGLIATGQLLEATEEK